MSGLDPSHIMQVGMGNRFVIAVFFESDEIKPRFRPRCIKCKLAQATKVL